MAVRSPGRQCKVCSIALVSFLVAGVVAHAETLDDLNRRFLELYGEGNYTEAAKVGERAVTLAEKTLKPNDSRTADALHRLATLTLEQGNYAAAEVLHRRSLAIREKVFGPNHPNVALSLNGLALDLMDQGKFADAAPLFERSLAIYQKALGSNHHSVASLLGNLATLYSRLGQFSKAEPLFRQSLAIDEKILGQDDPAVAKDLQNLGGLYWSEGKYATAESFLQRSIAITEKILGPENPQLARSLNALALTYQRVGKLEMAEPIFRRSLEIVERALGPDHPSVASVASNLGNLYSDQGNVVAAERLIQRSLTIREKTLGLNHLDVAISLNLLAGLYKTTGKSAEAKALLLRALAIRENALGANHPDVASDLLQLGNLYIAEGNRDAAEPLFRRVLAIREIALGPEHPDVAIALSNLASLYQDEGKFDAAEPLLQRSLAIREKVFGTENESVATTINNLATFYAAQHNYADAERLYERALTIVDKASGPERRFLPATLGNLGMMHFDQENWLQAAAFWNRGTNLLESSAFNGTLAINGQDMKGVYIGLVKASYRGLDEQREPDQEVARSMFIKAQWVLSSNAGNALAQMAARAAAGTPQLARLVRERQDLMTFWQVLYKAEVAAAAQPPNNRNREAEADTISRLEAVEADINKIDMRLKSDFPAFTALENFRPESIEDVQRVLRADEALILTLDSPEIKPTPDETFLWVVTKTDVRWVRSDLGTASLTREVAALRCGLDATSWWYPADAESDTPTIRANKVAQRAKSAACLAALGNRAPEKDAQGNLIPSSLPFDHKRAYQFYTALFGQFEDLIKGKHLLIVPSGSLTEFPFQVLVTKVPTDFDNRRINWLAREHAITILPTVSSLKALREFAKQSHATEPFIGFGNPLLDGEPDKYPTDAEAAIAARAARCPAGTPQQVASLSGRGGGVRGIGVGEAGLADVTKIRIQQPLPETAQELCDVARDLGVDPASHLYLGARATEAEVKQLSNEGTLAKYKIVHFATHGFVAGQLSGTSEPGLILTPPQNASEADDGYLSASEIASLRLDADWVILSACNTAAGGADNAEALSGVARAFFYAGARSLLVSHWAVNSDAAVTLITKAVSELNADPKIGRAEALRRSMLSMITTGKEHEAHPAFWAPFVLVGEGAAPQ
jgi:CHAT domain-containing protein/tetratricopeptide (TPR) repeat protein